VLAATVPDAFTRLHLCDEDEHNVRALRHRLRDASLPMPPAIFHGDANSQIGGILRQIPGEGTISVVFADPYGLHLDFESVRQIAARRCDLIVLLADNMDALRNWAAYYITNPNSPLDRFMGEPGWREQLLSATSDRHVQIIRTRYVDRLRGELGYKFFDLERIKNDRGSDIYTLVYASKHKLGLKFWSEAGRIGVDKQRRLNF
jgi:three-Cys-motif partner protein